MEFTISEPELAITLDFNVKSGSVVKKTSILKEPSVEKEAKRHHSKFSSRESSVAKDHHHEKIYANDLVKGLESVVPLASKKEASNEAINATDGKKGEDSSSDKLHTLRYSEGGVLSNKPAQAATEGVARSIPYYKSAPPPVAPKPATEKGVAPVHHHIPTKPASLITSDLPYIDESDLELDEAIRDAIGMEQDRLVTSIQLASPSSDSYSNASTLLISQRSCSGTDTIHMSEKVIQRSYRDL